MRNTKAKSIVASQRIGLAISFVFSLFIVYSIAISDIPILQIITGGKIVYERYPGFFRTP